MDHFETGNEKIQRNAFCGVERIAGVGLAIRAVGTARQNMGWDMTAGHSVTATLARGLTILDAFRVAQAPLRHRDIVARTALPKATVTRLVRTLCDQGYLERLGTERFRVGENLMALGAMSIDQSPLVATAAPLIAELSRRNDVFAMLLSFKDDTLNVLYEHGHDDAYQDGEVSAETTRLVDLVVAASLGRAARPVVENEDLLGRTRFALGMDGYASSCMASGIHVASAVAAPVRVEGSRELTLMVAGSPTGDELSDVTRLGKALVKVAKKIRRDPQ